MTIFVYIYKFILYNDIFHFTINMNLSLYGLLHLTKSYRQQNSNFLTILVSFRGIRGISKLCLPINEDVIIHILIALFLFKLKTCIVYCFEVTAIKINTFIVTIGKTIYNLQMFHVQLNVPIYTNLWR